MNTEPFTKAIVHFDGDSFFASIEQVLDYKLRGKPVITGLERGAATSLSYEAKRKGANRGMSIKEIRAICPDAVFVNSDYTSYSIYAHRMYTIVRRFTSRVEEYSIDECFADITGLESVYAMSYEEIACMIKQELERSLGVTFGVGLGPSKVLAKIASKHKKPAGFTHITKENVTHFLEALSIGKVWGIGSSTGMNLNKIGVTTALDFVQKNTAWLLEHHIHKPYQEIWAELQGFYVKPISLSGVDIYPGEAPSEKDIGSIIKSKTFTPPSDNKFFIFSELSKNVEAACAKARRHYVCTQEISFYLKTQEFTYSRMEISLPCATDVPEYMVRVIKEKINSVYRPHVLYRATGVTLRALKRKEVVTHNLFEPLVEAHSPVAETIDMLNKKYGKQTVCLASSLAAIQVFETKKSLKKKRYSLHLPHDRKKKTIDIPFLGIAH